jgi:hypothetical protein
LGRRCRSATWNANRWSASLTASRAFDYVNYDRIALARSLVDAPGSTTSPLKENLRDYWQTYEGITHLDARFSRQLPSGLSFYLTGKNLLNQQVGEPDNLTVIPGRSLSLGVSASF